MGKSRWEIAFWIGCLLIITLGPCGCSDLFPSRAIRERGPEVQQPASTSYRFEDIPLPSGMTLNRKESFVYETKEIRTGLLIYEGKGEIEKLTKFFKQQMPNY